MSMTLDTERVPHIYTVGIFVFGTLAIIHSYKQSSKMPSDKYDRQLQKQREEIEKARKEKEERERRIREKEQQERALKEAILAATRGKIPSELRDLF